MQHIYVHCNPYEVLDHNGFPCATFPFDPEHAGGGRRWIGASVDVKATDGRSAAEALKDGAGKPVQSQVRIAGKAYQADTSPRTRLAFAHDLTPQPIPSPASKHYRDGVRSGSLFPATAADAKALGMPAKDWKDPALCLAKARDAAIKTWTDSHDGEPPPFDRWPENLQGGDAAKDDK